MSKQKRYVLRVAVNLHSINAIADLETATEFIIGEIHLTMAKHDRYLVLKAGEFITEDDANQFLSRIKAGLWNLALEYNIAFRPDFSRRQITRSADPEGAGRNLAQAFGLEITGSVHGLADEGGFTVFESDEDIKFISFGTARGYVTTQLKDVIRVIKEGIEAADVNVVSKDPKLSTAIDLYLAHFYEQSIRARFLTLIMVLEVMAPVTEKHLAAQELISKWKAELQEQLSQVHERETVDSLEALDRELEFRRETSIRRRIRKLIFDVISLDQNDKDELAGRVVSAYDLRGSLVHSGTVDDSKLRTAYDAVFKVVKVLLRTRIGFHVETMQ